MRHLFISLCHRGFLKQSFQSRLQIPTKSFLDSFRKNNQLDKLLHWPPWSILNLDLTHKSTSGKDALWFIDNPLDLWMSYIGNGNDKTEESCGKKVWEKRREGMMYYALDIFHFLRRASLSSKSQLSKCLWSCDQWPCNSMMKS